MLELYFIKQAHEDLANLFEPEISFAVRALFNQDSSWFQTVNAVHAKQCIAFVALVRLSWDLVADHTEKNVSLDTDALAVGPSQLKLRLWHGCNEFLYLAFFDFHLQTPLILNAHFKY